jgi:hypothetical protein
MTYLMTSGMSEMLDESVHVDRCVPLATFAFQAASPSKRVDHGRKLSFRVEFIVTHSFLLSKREVGNVSLPDQMLSNYNLPAPFGIRDSLLEPCPGPTWIKKSQLSSAWSSATFVQMPS